MLYILRPRSYVVLLVWMMDDGRTRDRLDWRGIADAGHGSPASSRETL
jgi:hypothetical protein